jgi:hypothetical protein
VTETTPTSATAWEQELRGKLAGHRLAGELRISEDDLSEIERQLEGLVDSGLGTRILRNSYPALLVVYLTSAGVYRYEAGSYWPSVRPARRIQAYILGGAFKEAVRTLGLETFDDLVEGEGAAEYVARILAHGGIPRYCLGDYFSALHSGLRYTDDLLSLWRTRRERLAHLDKPVGRFLRYGGAVAVDLVTRSTDLVHETAARGQVPRAEDIGLPEYFVEEYDRWRRRTPAPVPGTRAFSIVRPHVELDPWSTIGPHLVLPALRGGDGWWTVAGEQGATQTVRVSDTHEQVVRLRPSRAWEVSLELASGVARSFSYEAYGELPALFFEPARATLVRDPLNLQLESALCLVPEGAKVEVVGGDSTPPREPAVIERYPSPTGDWRGFELSHLDLEGVARLRLTHGDVDRMIRVSPPALRPSLEGDLVEGSGTEEGLPVYRVAPRLRIPDELLGINWSLRVRAGAAAETATAIVRADAFGFIPLPTDVEFGEVEIGLTGPLGSDLHERFAIVPGLKIEIPDRMLLPGDVGAKANISVEDGLLVNGLSRSEDVAIPDQVDILVFGATDATGRTVKVHARMPRLVWSLVSESGVGGGFTAEKVRIDAANIEDGAVRALMVRTGRPGSRLILRLSSRTGVVQQRDPIETEAEGRWAFDLRPFQDAVRTSVESKLGLELVVGIQAVPVADIVARYLVSDIEATSRTAGDFTEVALHFNEASRFNDRVARLWSLDRPWQDAVEGPMRDGSDPPAVIRAHERIPPGPYLAQIIVDDGWGRPVKPAATGENVARIFVGDHQDWRTRVERLNQDDLLEALEAIVANGHVSDATLEALDFGPVAQQSLDAFVWMLGDIPRGSPLPGTANAVRKALLDTFGAFFRAIAGAPQRGEDLSVLRRVELLCLRRLDSHPDMTEADGEALEDDEVRALWRAAPAVAASVDLVLQPRSEASAARLSQQLTGEEPPLVAPAGFRVDPHLLGRSAELLGGIADVLEAYPGPLLTRRTLEAAYLEFLVAASEQTRGDDSSPPADWFDRHQGLMGSLLGIPGYRAALDERLPEQGVLRWAGFPALTLAAAIHMRRQTRLWQRATLALDEALVFAPTLVEHDLVAASVLIARLRAEGQPC